MGFTTVTRWMTRCEHCGGEGNLFVRDAICPHCDEGKPVGLCECGCRFESCRECLSGRAFGTGGESSGGSGHCFHVVAEITDDISMMYVITENPSDFPGLFVLRVWRVGTDGRRYTSREPFQVRSTLTEIRKFLPVGTVRCEPDANDDPVIKEFWI